MRGTAGTAAGTNTESGSGGSHTAGTGTESTQGYKPTSSLIKHLISTMLLVVLFSSTVENAYAYVEMFMFMLVSITSFLWIKACCKMARCSTIQKLDRSFSSASFAASLKPPPLQDGGANYKIWRTRATLWFTAMHCEHAVRGKRIEPPLSAEEARRFDEADNLFRGDLLSVLAESMLQVYMDMPTGKDMWDALEANFRVADAGTELYKME